MKVNRKIRNCAMFIYVYSASQSAKPAKSAAAAAAAAAAANLKPHRLLLSLGQTQLAKRVSAFWKETCTQPLAARAL